jgi:phage terminase large subunit-like protein
MPENQAARHERTDHVPYIAWAQRGHCTLTPGDVTDNSYVYNWICAGEREHRWKIVEVDYDGHNATDLAIKICTERNDEDFCAEIQQTCAGQNLAVKGFRELLLQNRIIIEENPLVIWCLANAIEIQNNYGDIKLSKKHKDDTERIDPVAAVMNALARALVRRENPTLADRIDRGQFSM